MSSFKLKQFYHHSNTFKPNLIYGRLERPIGTHSTDAGGHGTDKTILYGRLKFISLLIAL